MAIASDEVVGSATASRSMKSVHRRWHKRIGWVLVPIILATLCLAGLMHPAPLDNVELPPILKGASGALGSR